jgi:hypothetical protein
MRCWMSDHVNVIILRRWNFAAPPPAFVRLLPRSNLRTVEEVRGIAQNSARLSAVRCQDICTDIV